MAKKRGSSTNPQPPQKRRPSSAQASFTHGTSHARYMVSTSAEEGREFNEVVRRLRKAGLKIENESADLMPTVGTIFGVAERARREELGAIEGVRGIEEQQEYQLPPPGAPVQ